MHSKKAKIGLMIHMFSSIHKIKSRINELTKTNVLVSHTQTATPKVCYIILILWLLNISFQNHEHWVDATTASTILVSGFPPDFGRDLIIDVQHWWDLAPFAFQFIPKVLGGVEVVALCRPVYLWILLCAQGHCQDETIKELPQSVPTKLDALCSIYTIIVLYAGALRFPYLESRKSTQEYRCISKICNIVEKFIMSTRTRLRD